jgi:hypothetical protein
MASPNIVDPQTFALGAITFTALATALGLAAWAVFWRGLVARVSRQQAQMRSLELRCEEQAQAMRGELQRLERSLGSLSDRQESDTRFGSLAPRAKGSGYEMAIRMAASGATDTELVAACGMSRDEAELVMRLHGRRSRTVA